MRPTPTAQYNGRRRVLGTEKCAQRLHLPYLGAIPMFTELRVNSDAGNPTANFTGNPQLRDALERITQTLTGEVSKRNMGPGGPELTIS